MKQHRRLGRAQSLAWSLAVATGAIAALTAGISPASADSPLDRARAQAHALAASVAELQTKAEVASEAYDRSSAALSDAVARRIQAADALTAASGAANAARAAAGAQARALYQSGGGLTMYAGVLESGDLGALAERVTSVHHLVAADEAIAARAQAASASASALASALDRAQSAQLTLENSAAQAAATVRTSLAQQSSLLASASQQVRDLLAQQQAEMAAAAAAAFQDKLVAAYAAAGVPLVLGSTSGVPAGPVQAAAVKAMEALVASSPPYVWGGTGPVGYDCSGLTGAAYAAAGLDLPRTAAQQYESGIHPALTDLKPGDLLFWATTPGDASSIHHVAMYAGGDLMWSADHTGDVARLQPIWGDGFFGATRPDATTAAAVPGPFWQPGS